MKEKDRQQKEAKELKKKHEEEREEKKREREEDRERRRKRERKKDRGRRRKERKRRRRKRKRKRRRQRKRDSRADLRRPKKGKQPVQAAMESLGSSNESECEVRSRSQTVRQLPGRFWADSRSESESSDSGILCVLCSAREPQT